MNDLIKKNTGKLNYLPSWSSLNYYAQTVAKKLKYQIFNAYHIQTLYIYK